MMNEVLENKFKLNQNLISSKLTHLRSEKCGVISIMLGEDEQEGEVWYLVRDIYGFEDEVSESDLSPTEVPLKVLKHTE